MRLSTKFNLLATALVVGTGLGIGGFVGHQLVRENRTGLRQHGTELAEMAAYNGLYAAYTENARELDQMLRGVGTSPDVTYMIVYAADGRQLASRRFGGKAAPPRFPLLRDDLQDRGPLVHEATVAEAGEGNLHILAPIVSRTGDAGSDPLDPLAMSPGPRGVVGYVQIGVTDARMRSRLSGVLLSTAGFVGLLATGGALVTALVARRISRPIRALTEATRRTADGDLTQAVDVRSSDEVAELSVHFNCMVERLRSTREALEQEHEVLEERVRERTEALQRRTREAEDLAEAAKAASRAKSQFLANMSHEIRTPMNGVLGMIELLAGTDLTELQRRFAETVRQSAHQLLNVINDILDISKAEAGRLTLELTDCNVREIVEDVMDLLAQHAHQKDLELAYAISEEVPVLARTDSSRLNQVLTNLVGNAVKFTERGEVVADLTAEAMELAEDGTERRRLRFAVSDTGIGVPPEARERLFQAFSQADGSMARRFGGTGLGLAISKQLVELMGGEMGFSSQPGGGSTFWFTVPVVVVRQKGDDSPDTERLRDARVFVVDDNETNRRIVGHQLAGWGARVATATNGPEALEELTRAVQCGEPFELAVLDLAMPEMSGLDLVRAVRADARLRALPIVMLTSIGLEIGAEEQRHLGIVAHLPKPARQSEFQRALIQALGGRAAAAETEGRAATARGPAIAADVLLAEDNRVNQEVAVWMLEEIGCRVELAKTGLEAVAAVKRRRFDVILMDCQMPEMDGFEATARIRAWEAQLPPEAPRLPVVALTAHAMQGDREQCLQAGMNDYLSKPVSSRDLQRILERWVPHRIAASGAASPETPESTPLPARESATPEAGLPLAGGGEEPLLDQGVWDELRRLSTDSGAELVRTLVQTYQTDAAPIVERIRAAVAAGDLQALARAAHSLKSSTLQLGGPRLAQVCKELEGIGRSGAAAPAKLLLSRLERELDLFLGALVDELS